MKIHEYYVYILTNRKRGTLYTGVTRNLEQRITAHKQKLVKGFTEKYDIDRMVYYEGFQDAQQAINREKQIKRYKREYKYNLIEAQNPHWDDLAKDWFNYNISSQPCHPGLVPGSVVQSDRPMQSAIQIPAQGRDDKREEQKYKKQVYVYLGLGANLPFNGQPPVETIQAAIARLPEYGFNVVKVSNLYRSPPWLGMAQPDYVNIVVAVQTTLSPPAAMQNLLQIETIFGRLRSIKNAARTLDMDIIAWGDELISDDRLTIPHPYLAERAFVLLPLHDVAPDWRHPQTGQTITELIAACGDCAHIRQL